MKKGIIDDTFLFYMLILFINKRYNRQAADFFNLRLIFLQAEFKGGNAKSPYLRGIFHFGVALYVALKWAFSFRGDFLDFLANFKNFSHIIHETKGKERRNRQISQGNDLKLPFAKSAQFGK